MRKNRLFLLALVFTVIVLTACNGNGEGNNTESSGGSFSFEMADTHAEGFPTILGNEEFARLIEDTTGGEIDITVFSGGVLGDEATTLQQVQLGAIDMVRVPVTLLASLDAGFDVLALPYIWNDSETMLDVLDGELGDYFRYRLNENGLHGLVWYYPGARHIYNSSHEILTPDDLSGLRIRVQENQMMMGLIQHLGGAPTPMPFGEVYSGIQTGVVNGAENNLASFISTAHFEVAPFITLTAHTLSPELVVINLDAWESLSSEQQDAMTAAARGGAALQRIEQNNALLTAEQTALDQGVTITRLTAEERQAFGVLMAPLYDEFSQFQDLIDRVRGAQ